MYLVALIITNVILITIVILSTIFALILNGIKVASKQSTTAYIEPFVNEVPIETEFLPKTSPKNSHWFAHTFERPRKNRYGRKV